MHIDILIDASGSMGYMKGAGVKHENQYLIDANHTRTDLVKSILINQIIPKITYCTFLQIDSFRNEKERDNLGNPIIKNRQYVERPAISNHYKGKFNKSLIIKEINNIPNPEPGGTPLRSCLVKKIDSLSSSKSNIIVITDGDGFVGSKLDEDWHNVVYKKILASEKEIKIHIIGIAQSDIAKAKSKVLCSKTKGVYTNLDSVNYDSSTLDNLLFSLKSNITSQAIKEQVASSPTNSLIVEDRNALSKSSVAVKKEENSSNNELEARVEKNTQSLSLISNQLDNIIKLLKPNESLEEENNINVIENEEHNKRIGRKAEAYLYDKLLKYDCEEIIWLNEKAEQYLPYDFKIKQKDEVFYYECKGTASDSNEFLVTKKEWQFYLENRNKYRLCFVSNVDSQPSHIKFMDLINDIEKSKLLPCSSVNKKIKANRIIFQVL